MPGYGASRSVDTDAGLRAHMLGVFRNMGLGLVITGLVAALVGNTPALAAAIYGTPLKWVAIFAPLAFVFFFSFRIEKMTTSGARMAFYAFAAVMGVSLGSVFLVAGAIGGVWGSWQNICSGDGCPSIAQIRTFEHEQTSKLFSFDGRQIHEIGFERRSPVSIHASCWRPSSVTAPIVTRSLSGPDLTCRRFGLTSFIGR